MWKCVQFGALAAFFGIAALWAPSAQAFEVPQNGSFETGDSTGWRVRGQTNSNGQGFGNWYFTTNSSGPISGRGGEAPSDGSFQAYIDVTGSGSYILYQDVTLPDYESISLHFTWWIKNEWSDYSNPDSLDRRRSAAGPNQQFRVDIMDPSVPYDWVTFGVLQNILATQPGDPRFTSPTTVEADLSAFAGQTIRLRFAGVNSENFLRVGVDSVHIEVHPFVPVASGLGVLGGAVVDWGDYDEDGDFDVLMSGSNTLGGTFDTRVYRNDGGSFALQPYTLPGVAGGTTEWIDYDGDGDLDICASGLQLPSGQLTFLYENTGTSFLYEEDFIDLHSSATAWGDYDNDGDLDFFIAGQDAFAEYARLYENTGGAFFVDIHSLPIMSLGSCQWADFDEDGDLDMLQSGNGTTDVYRNEGNGSGIFTPLGAGLAGLSNTACDWGDYDGDGDLDILLSGEVDALSSLTTIYRNDAGTFTDINPPFVGLRGGSAEWGDYDNDGDFDVLLTGASGSVITAVPRTVLYEQTLSGWVEVSTDLPDVENGMAIWGDYDDDGDLDILIAGVGDGIPGPNILAIYENTIGTGNSAPNPPYGLLVEVSGTTATFDWFPGSDNETGPLGLNHNMWAGSSPVQSDVMPGHSSMGTGYRRLAALGNTGTTSAWRLNVADVSYLYWGVQTIDPAYAGSAFAPGPTFHFAPLPTNVTDVPNDQGGWVRLHMNRSDLDWTGEAQNPVATYNVWRQAYLSAGSEEVFIEANAIDAQDPRASRLERAGLAMSSLTALELYESEGRVFTRGSAGLGASLPPGIWELVGSFAAAQQSTYSFVAPTLADSGGASPYKSVFTVSAHTTIPSLWFASSPDTGYSIDNLAPGVPQSFSVDAISPQGDVDLSWDPSTASDFQYFALYRGTDVSFVPDETSRIAQVTGTNYTDPGGQQGGGGIVYKLTALDFAGNESQVATVVTGTVSVGNPGTPLAFALHGNVPNPIINHGVIRFDLPVTSAVTLMLYDVQGRVVAAPYRGDRLPAGSHQWAWNRRDQLGTRVPAGIYFYRFRAGSFHETRKAIVTD